MLNYTTHELKEIKSLKDLQKDKTEVLNDLFTTYENTTKATKTQIGFIYNKQLFAIILDNLSIDMVKLSTESRGGLKLKMLITKALKTEWVTSGKATKIMTEKHFNNLVDNSIYNKGEILEKILTEKRGIEWVKDSTRYDKAGDIDLKTRKIQIKFENASLTSANTMARVVSGN